MQTLITLISVIGGLGILVKMDTAISSKSANTSTQKGSKGGAKKGRKRKVGISDEVVAKDPDQQEQQSSDTIYSCITLEYDLIELEQQQKYWLWILSPSFSTYSEKKRLLNVIKQKGFGIIYNPELLLDEFPGRSRNEISWVERNFFISFIPFFNIYFF